VEGSRRVNVAVLGILVAAVVTFGVLVVAYFN
jgi:hypothetical protein